MPHSWNKSVAGTTIGRQSNGKLLFQEIDEQRHSYELRERQCLKLLLWAASLRGGRGIVRSIPAMTDTRHPLAID